MFQNRHKWATFQAFILFFPTKEPCQAKRVSPTVECITHSIPKGAKTRCNSIIAFVKCRKADPLFQPQVTPLFLFIPEMKEAEIWNLARLWASSQKAYLWMNTTPKGNHSNFLLLTNFTIHESMNTKLMPRIYDQLFLPLLCTNSIYLGFNILSF